MAAAAASKAAPADAAAAPVAAAPPPKKRLILIGSIVLALLLVGAAGAAFYVMKQRAAAAAAADDEADDDASNGGKQETKAVKADLKSAPTFVALEPFTVNLADRDAERYAQVGMTLELVDTKAGDLLKAYMPAIRNNILLVLAGKSAAELMEHDGKLLLAAQVRAAALKPLGYEVPDPAAAASGAARARKPVAADDGDEPPVRAVHFSNFIIQ